MLSDRHHALRRREEGNNEVSRLSADKMESMRVETVPVTYITMLSCVCVFVDPARLSFLD